MAFAVAAVITKFSEDAAPRLEQTCHTALSPSASLSIRGKTDMP
jgi:hypothetical protein